ncbi:aldehyde dehydrogenase family protein [Desulfacinum hydrothermale]|uniref:aldehyde dehydrogenase family protein n=1 Tax=Desulfacinum hydrothermale TaxID=109258 RepID=UPI001483CC41|nr:aldehyde dehydrogenase family protein [Desulfacinum hydrothermale]
MESQIPEIGCRIGGREVRTGPWMPVLDPATGQPIARVPACDEGVVADAVSQALRSQPAWADLPVGERAALLGKWAEAISRHLDHLALLTCRETGKPLRAARAEVDNAVHLIHYFAEEARRLTGHLPLTGKPGSQTLVLREPVGVVAAITPFNYPISTLVTKAAPALAVGCSVVAKPDEHTPLATLEMARLAEEVGCPSGVFQVVTGPGPETGKALVSHPQVALVTFTGSTEVGKLVQRLAADHVKRVLLELGGHCPAIVCRDADWQGLLPSVLSQAFKNSGQYCYRITRIYVAREIWDPFLTRLTSAAAALKVGDPREPETDLGPLNNRHILERVHRQVQEAVDQGARVVLGGPPLPEDAGLYFPPTVLTDLHPGMDILHQEIFGPVLLVLPFAQEQEAVEGANDSPFGLAAYVFSGDLARALRLSHRIRAGSIWINQIHQARPEAPFGGMKQSGLGREKSRFGLEAFTELKTVYLSY